MPQPALRSRAPRTRPSAPSELESCPPLAPRRRFGWSYALGWPRPSGFGTSSAGAAENLCNARLDFADAVVDICSEPAFSLQSRIAAALSLHDLWHLREEAFSLISLRHSQHEAARRLARLSRHFAPSA